MAPTLKAEPVPFREAIDYHRGKVRLPTRAWTDLWEGMHARAFVVAGAMKDALLADLQAAVGKAIEQGTTLAEFRKDFDRIVATHGWQYKGGRDWRTRVILDTNIRMGHSAGRWAQIQRLKSARPFLRYIAILDGRTRPEHRALHGTVLPVDHPFWDTHTPPNGWYCRCTVQQLSRRDLDRWGYTESRSPDIEWEAKGIATPEGHRTVRVPKGIDPGFAYNPGRAAWGNQLSEQAMDGWRKSGAEAWESLTPGDWQSAGRPKLVPLDKPKARLGPPAADAEAMAAAVERAIGGAERIFVQPDGGRVLVNAETFGGHIALPRAPFVPFLPELLEDPFEVWLSFEQHKGTGKVVLRRRILKIIDGLDRGKLVLVAEVRDGMFEGWTFVPSDRAAQIDKQRRGQLLFGR
ncbi:MAG: phage minor head protein [Magnetospirillum sp. WYHS-4]